MPKLKVLSGADVIKILCSYGFAIEKQKGSHVKLARTRTEGPKEILTVPAHKELDKGTLKAIFRQASKYVSENQLYEHFYG